MKRNRRLQQHSPANRSRLARHCPTTTAAYRCRSACRCRSARRCSRPSVLAASCHCGSSMSNCQARKISAESGAESSRYSSSGVRSSASSRSIVASSDCARRSSIDGGNWSCAISSPRGLRRAGACAQSSVAIGLVRRAIHMRFHSGWDSAWRCRTARSGRRPRPRLRLWSARRCVRTASAMHNSLRQSGQNCLAGASITNAPWLVACASIIAVQLAHCPGAELRVRRLGQ